VVRRGKKDEEPELLEELNSRVPTMKNPPPPPVKRASPSFIKPAAGNVSSPFRPPHRPTHHGIDIARVGNVPIVAAADGVVVRSYSSKTYGETVIIEHDFGGDKWQTLYAHLRSGTRAATGAIVNKGEQIGMMGNTGRSTAQHLHFEIHRGPWNSAKSNAVDPLQFIKA
jgi:murein DD-endopeptidase MepM/ murein hydrolase activator NlpD